MKFLMIFLMGILVSMVSQPQAHAGTDRHHSSGFKWRFAYSDEGYVTKIVDPAGRVTRISYEFDKTTNAIKKLTKRLPDDTCIIYEFDRSGRLVKMADPSGTVRYRYDEGGNLVDVLRDGWPQISFSYDTLDRLKSVSLGKGMTISYFYDFLGRLSQIKTPCGDITYEYWTGQGKVIRTLPNRIRTIYEYQIDGTLRSITHVSGDNKVLARFIYSYRPDGLVDTAEEFTQYGSRIVKYGYDKLQRLISVADSSGLNIRYQYDEFGNRLVKAINGKKIGSFEYNWAGQMIRHNGSPCTHDPAGNLMTYGSGSGRGDKVFDFNTQNLLKAVFSKNGSGVKYRYDGTGRLIERMFDGKKTRYVPDPLSDIWRPFLETDSQENSTFYVWEGRIPLIAISGSNVRFFLHDRLGSVRLVTDASGHIIESFNYSPFGSPRQQLKRSSLQPGFAGLFYDPFASLYLTRTRAYDPELGRFLQMDPQFRVPTGTQKDLSSYAYCGSDPVNFMDLTGCAPEPDDPSTWESIVVQHRQESYPDAPSLDKYFDPQLLLSKAKGKAVEKVIDMVRKQSEVVDTLLYIKDEAETALKTGKQAMQAKGFVDFFEVGLRLLNQFSRETLGGFAASTLLEAKELYSSMYQDASAVLTQRANESLVRFPLGVSQQVRARSTGTAYRNRGWFSMKGHNNFVANGGWNRFEIPNGTTVTNMYARWGFNHVWLPTGARMSGSFSSSVRETNDGKVYTKRSYSRSNYHVYYNGAAVSKAVEEYNKTGVYNPAKWYARLGHKGFDSSTRSVFAPSMSSVSQEMTEPRKRPPQRPSKMLGDTRCYHDSFFPPPPPPPPPPALVPSNVGGVYLRGAGDALKHLGRIKGIAIDRENGRLILLSEKQGDMNLPPLRLDDVVIVFRSVYEHGGPFVSIDPDPEDPTGPYMKVRHDEGTEKSYVGWVLFETDRLMKAYSLGYDNVSRRPVDSRIKGYKDLLDLGFSSLDEESRQTVWERFWIVPDRVDVRQNVGEDISLMDVPLKVNSQRMVMQDGKLVPAKGKEPSPQAKAFSTWFTKAYNQIAKEAMVSPPKGSGIKGPVPVFSELRRIALITAIAERLRDQGVPLPAWMRDYHVRSFNVPGITPAIVVEASKTDTKLVSDGTSIKELRTTRTKRIYGGVDLVIPEKEIHVAKGAKEAEELAPSIHKKILSSPMASPVTIKEKGKEIKAVALPGDNTRVLGAARLTEIDLVVPVQRGTEIRLTRRFNSFFQPVEGFGKGWSLDLPRLSKERMPVGRDRKEFRIIYRLTSPFHSLSCTFGREGFIQEVNGWLLVPESQGPFLGLGRMEDEKIGVPTDVVMFRDGRQWHFDESGSLVARVKGPFTEIYRRDKGGRIRRIEGWYGDKLRADIQVEYDRCGRIVAARGSNNAEVEYRYSKDGLLLQAKRQDGLVEYSYKDSLVTAIFIDKKKVRQFEYSNRGRLLWEKLANGTKRTYTVSQDAEGFKVTASSKGGSTCAEYDRAMRPIKMVLQDGTLVQWKYGDKDKMRAEIFRPTGEWYQVDSSPEGRRITKYLPQGENFSIEYDSAGRLTRLLHFKKEIFQQKWHPSGLVTSATWETTAFHPEYSNDSVLTGLLVTPPVKGSRFKQWLHIGYDELGRPKRITDYTGSDTKIGYDKTGEASVVVSKLGGIKVKRDDNGRPLTIQTSWGYRQDNSYDPDTGQIRKIDISRGQYKATILYENGRPTTVKQFDGGELDISYYRQGPNKGRIKQIRCPNDAVLKYDYDSQGRLSEISCGGTYELRLTYDTQGRVTELSQTAAVH